MQAGVLLGALVAATPADHVETSIAAVLDADFLHVRVHVKTRWTPGEDADRVTVILAADRYREPPSALTPSGKHELFRGTFDTGGFESVAIAVDGAPCAPELETRVRGERFAHCAHPVRAGDTATVEIDAVLKVPDRYGPFGRRRREVTLGGAWYPFVARPASPPPHGPHDVTLRAPAGYLTLIGERVFHPAGGDERTITAHFDDASQIPLIVRPGSARGVPAALGAVRIVSWPASIRTDAPLELRVLHASIEDGLRFWREEGMPDVVSRDDPLVVVIAPLHHELAQALEGPVLVSENAFRLFPLERGHRFHRLPILREVFGAMLRRALRKTQPPGEVALAADALASWLVDRYDAVRSGRPDDARSVLKLFSFIPAIDGMLYAPEFPFVSAFFRVVDEDDPLHDDFADYPMDLPRGRRIYEKLGDLRGIPALRGAFERVLAGAPFLDAVEEAVGEGGSAFLATWLGPYPDVRYRLSRWSSRPEGDGWVAEVEIAREGNAIAEPIQVRIEAEDGSERLVIASATTSAKRTVTATLSAPLDLVEIDPFGRIAETPTYDDPSPRFDNRSSPGWKLLLNNFNLLLSPTAGTLDTALDIGFGKKFDVHWRHAIRAEYGSDAISVAARTTYGFGEAVTPARLDQSLSLIVSGDYLRPGFAGSETAGFALTTTAIWSYDDRLTVWSTEPGTAFRFSAQYNHVFGDLPPDDTGKRLTPDAFALSARAIKQWQVLLAHQLAVKGSFSAYLTGQPRQQLLYALGGRYGARGYEVDAKVGKVRSQIGAEWVHPIAQDTRINAAWSMWLTAIDGALFGELAIVADDFSELTSAPVYGDVGYGLRFYLDWLGIRPGVLAVDVAFPLVGLDGRPGVGPPAVYIDFSQSYVNF